MFKRGKVRWIKTQFISFPMLWPNYVASLFHASKSHPIGLDVKGCWFTASLSWLKLNLPCIKILSAINWTHTKILVHRSHVSASASSPGCSSGLDVSSYIPILTRVTTAQEISPVQTKQASKWTQERKWWSIDPWGYLNHVYRKFLSSPNCQTARNMRTCVLFCKSFFFFFNI